MNSDDERDTAERDKLLADVLAAEAGFGVALDKLADVLRRAESSGLTQQQIQEFCLDLGIRFGVPADGPATLEGFRVVVERLADESWASAQDADSTLRELIDQALGSDE